MNTKIVVKVMNFHALLRVDASRKLAEKYIKVEKHISEMITNIMFNRNLMLDKKVIMPSPQNPVLNIYFGSDYGFCGGINSQVGGSMQKSPEVHKIIIGRKLRTDLPNTLLNIARDEFDKNYAPVERIVFEAVNTLKYSEINIVYEHFHNTSNIELVKKRIFPLDLDSTNVSSDDFIIEGDPSVMLTKLLRAYVNYEIKIASVNCYASENILRQNTTTESMKKIDQREEEKRTAERKRISEREFKKVVDAFVQKKGMEKA